jgi:putative dimethyl sulfoxide reductase chaperone
VSSSDDERHGRAALGGAAVYGALSLGFSEPDAALLQGLLDGGLLGALREALNGPDGWEDCAAAARAVEECAAAALLADTTLEELRADYARLFTGPGTPAVACYESEYLEPPRADGRGRLGGVVASAVEAAYLQAGVTTAAGRREPPDFVAVELEFLYVLYGREAEAWAAGDAAEARRLRSASERFLADHAQRWLPAFAGAVQTDSRHPFYAALSGLLDCFLAAQRRSGVQAGVVANGPPAGTVAAGPPATAEPSGAGE